ncbi:cell shape determination protein CcmA [Rothia terrae]|uniref:Cell shape determination protein CcmA n=1 Tax=Rothia terrae TaxID=396015 RepID=A0A7H2BFC0_9MICC|nr:cell shape determination protein CcmA [Rothia terrae]MDT0190692.1 cell shape determination protein CcmA [Rothia terrae]NKZ34492.1 cell shape determination protein CcmA [Rothia terrae]QNV38366.1 cell shape determination protein CcmA [Rothia terrae]
MRALLLLLSDSAKLTKILFWYWLLSAGAFVLFAFTQASSTSTSFEQTLQQPSIALSFLISCMSIIQAVMLKMAHSENENTVRIFSIFSGVQQVLVGNIPAALLSYFLARSLHDAPREPFAPTWRWVLIGVCILLSFLTFLTLLARYNQFFGA